MIFFAFLLLPLSGKPPHKGTYLKHHEQGIGKPFQKPNGGRHAANRRDGAFRHMLSRIQPNGSQGNRSIQPILFRCRHHHLPFRLHAGRRSDRDMGIQDHPQDHLPYIPLQCIHGHMHPDRCLAPLSGLSGRNGRVI